ncbi:MAG: DUF802 domain-containing protein [Oleiphilaceae bacterium]|nr:DUF802 domain-containing protein [Oleiphilaceae bacterium]
MTRHLFILAFLIGFSSVVWMSQVFMNTDLLALTVTVLIGGVFIIGAIELMQFRRATGVLSQKVSSVSGPVEHLNQWLGDLPSGLQHAVRQRIEGERVGLPAPVLTPYLVGLLVMLGLLGTFVGMVDTLQGAVSALRESTELEAIRAGLAAPMQGLSLAFGTSVAGVSASAMLGLMSTLSRRERVVATRQLGSLIATQLRHFSLNYNRQETFKALQLQAQSLPEVANKMDAVANKLERMGETLGAQLSAKQDAFNEAVGERYTQLAESVATSLQGSLAQSSQLVGETIAPIIKQLVEDVRSELASTARTTQQNMSEAVIGQLDDLQTSFGETSAQVSQAWQQGIDAHRSHSKDLVEKVQQSVESTHAAFAQMSRELLSSLDNNAKAFIARQVEFEEQRLAMTTESLRKSQEQTVALLNETMSHFKTEQQGVSAIQREALQATVEEFKALSTAMLAQQNEQSNALRASVSEMVQQANEGSGKLLEQHTQLFEQSAQLAANRERSEQAWLSDSSARMDVFTQQLNQHLQALREDEQQRGEAAVARLTELRTTLAEQLASLGQALETPMSRLIETASEAPRAAAEIIAQLRAEISKNIERDNDLLDERKQTLAELNQLSQSLKSNTSAQGAAVAQLVSQSDSLLQDLGQRLSGQVATELGKLGEAADYFATSAVDMASLGEAFGAAVTAFGESNRQLLEGLAAIEQKLEQSALRNDEQLGYYVAQAREIIDHSIHSQQALLNQMRHLGKASEPATEVD